MTRKKRKTKYVAKYIHCHRCGQEHLDDPYFDHRCERFGGVMEYAGRAMTSARQMGRSSTLTEENLREAYRGLSNVAGGQMSAQQQERMRQQAEDLYRGRMMREEEERLERMRMRPPMREYEADFSRNAGDARNNDRVDAARYGMITDEERNARRMFFTDSST